MCGYSAFAQVFVPGDQHPSFRSRRCVPHRGISGSGSGGGSGGQLHVAGAQETRGPNVHLLHADKLVFHFGRGHYPTVVAVTQSGLEQAAELVIYVQKTVKIDSIDIGSLFHQVNTIHLSTCPTYTDA